MSEKPFYENQELNKNRRIAVAGICSALAFVFCFLGGVIPAGGVSMLVISSFIIGVIIVEAGKGYGAAAWLIVSILSLFFVINKIIAIFAVCVFLPYPIIKRLIEGSNFLYEGYGQRELGIKVKINPLKWILKAIFFTLASLLGFAVLKWAFGIDIFSMFMNIFVSRGIEIGYFVVALGVGCVALIVFVIYDILFSIFGKYYLNKYSVRMGKRK